MSGGHVVKSEAALSQVEFDLLKRSSLFKTSIDYVGMNNNPTFLEHLEAIDRYNAFLEKRALFLAEQSAAADSCVWAAITNRAINSLPQRY